MKKLSLIILALGSITSFAEDCSVSVSFESDVRESLGHDRRITKLIERKLVKKGYIVAQDKKEPTFSISIVAPWSCYDNIDAGFFASEYQSVTGNFINHFSGEETRLDDERVGSFVGYLTGKMTRKAIKTALREIPRCPYN